MARYLFVGSYTAEGIKGVLATGGTARRDAIASMVSNLGGTVESFYFAFGQDDAYAVMDLPDNVNAAAAAMAVAASGVASVKTVVLLSPEEVDRAAQVQVGYRPPGA